MRPAAVSVLLLLSCCAVGVHALAVSTDPPPRRAKKNKYAQFSKADEVRKSLRFSNIETDATEASAAPVNAPVVERTRERNKWLYPDEAFIDQRDPTTFGFVEIGRVLGAHGVHGEVKVSTQSDFALERLCTPGVRWLRRPRRRAPREVRLLDGRVGPGSGVFLVRLGGVRGRDDAQGLKGSYLYSRREVVPTLEEHELLLWQLEGLTVALARRSDGDGGSRSQADASAGGGGDGSAQDPRVEPGEVVGRVRGVVPREELTGSPELGHDLLEIELVRRGGGGDGGGGGAEEEGQQEEEEMGEPDTVLVPYVPQIVPMVLLEEGLLLIEPPPGLLELIQPRRKERVVIRALLPERAQSLLDGRVSS